MKKSSRTVLDYVFSQFTNVTVNFAAVETQLKQKHVPDIILKRHTDTVAQYRSELKKNAERT